MAKFTAEQLLDHLYTKRLPQVYREADIDTGNCLKRFLQSMIEGGYSEAISSADGITDLTDPLKCPDRLFPLLFESFGYRYSVDIPILYQRKILQNHGELYQKRGTVEYIYVLTRILTGFDCEVSIERVNNVRILSIKMFVDNSVTAVEQQHYVNLVKRFVTEGYIPFYLDVETNIVVDVIDVPIAQQYIASAVGVEGVVDISPIEEITKTGLTSSLYPTLEDEPFSKFNILGYSKIVPRYLNNNLINPNTAQKNISVTWTDTDTNNKVTVSSMSFLSDYLYVPYGNKLYLTLPSSSLKAPTVYIFVYTSTGERIAIGNRTIPTSKFVQGKAVVDLSDILLSDLCEADYYVKIGFIDNQGVSDVTTLLCAWVEDTEYTTYLATTRFKFDNEYYKNDEAFPIYMADVYDSNGAMTFPYCSEDNVRAYSVYKYGHIQMISSGLTSFIAYTDCNTAIKDDCKYYISFMLQKSAYNTLSSPILTALCSNGKGTFKEVILTNELEYYSAKENIYKYGYSFTVPHDYNVVRIRYNLCNTSVIDDTVVLSNVMCFECDPETGEPYIDSEFQQYIHLTNSSNSFKNNLSVGIDGIKLLSYNDSNGKVIVRDSFDVLKGVITRHVGVNYDSLGNPISVYKLNSPYTETVIEDFNGEVKPFPLATFRGKTYVSMFQSVPYSRYTRLGGIDYHSGIEFTTRIIK